jgi:hypothetical protein
MANHKKPSRNLKVVKEGSVNTHGTVAENQESSAVAKKAATLHESLLHVAQSAYKITGTQSEHAAARLLTQAGHALSLRAQKDQDARLIQGAAMMEAIAPQNATEALLSIQMLAIHEAALRFLMYATQEGQDLDAANASILQATRLARMFTEQLEAMQKLKGKTRQRAWSASVAR